MDIVFLKLKNIFLQKYYQYHLKYFKFLTCANEIYSWKSKGMSEQIIRKKTSDITSNNIFSATLTDTCLLLVIEFNENCLIRSSISAFRKVVNL